MAELSLSVRDYKNSVSLAAFISRIKDDIIALPSVTNAVFKPMINGYVVSFKEKGNSYNIELKVSKHIFLKSKLTVCVFEDSYLIKNFKAVDADKGIKEIKSIFIH